MYKPIDIHELKINQAFRWWLTRDNFFTKDECEELVEKIENEAKPKIGPYTRPEYAKYNKDIDTKMAEDICRLNTTEVFDEKYLNKIWGLIEIANKTVYKYDIQGIYKNKLQGHKYGLEDWYTPHADFHPIEHFSIVKLTLVVFLNTEGVDYQGGKFKFFDGTHIEGKQGRILIFPSFYGHEVRPITSGNRYSLVTWAVGDTFV